VGQPEREPGLLLSLYFRRNEKAVANSALMRQTPQIPPHSAKFARCDFQEIWP
jgi:hypothetical protein